MYLENLVFDAVSPRELGRFWEAALGTEPLTDEDEGYETRLAVAGGPILDLCFQRVPAANTSAHRLHLDISGEAASTERLLGLGASHRDIGQGDVPWEVLADPGDFPFCVVPDRPAYSGTGPLAALPLDSADPLRDLEFWAWLTGWQPVDSVVPHALRHPSGLGPILELVPQAAPKDGGKNPLHLDVRLEAGEHADSVEGQVQERGGRRLAHDWGDLPWRCYQDPSGNEFCVLPCS